MGPGNSLTYEHMSPLKQPRRGAAQRVRRACPAKINLYLHVVGTRPDGFHDLDSLIAFTGFGDEVDVAAADDLSLRVVGPFADAVPRSEENLVLRAAKAIREAAKVAAGAEITLTKNIPVAAGLGGGSADAAAALHALNELWQAGVTDQELSAIAGSLGADVPVCLVSEPRQVAGRGDEMRPAPVLPPCHLVLANPGVPLATAEVFARYSGPGSGTAPLQEPLADVKSLAQALSARQNDLEDAAQSLVPEIGNVLQALRAPPGCLLARMSGSGATCFALYEDASGAEAAAAATRKVNSDWWVERTTFA